MEWLLRLWHAGAGEVHPDVRSHLEAALKRRARVELVSLRDGGDAGPLVTTIEALHDGVIIAIPALRGVSRPLRRFQSVQCTFDDDHVRLTGTTHVRGRARFHAAAGGEGTGYRLAWPTALAPVACRRTVREAIGDPLREAVLTLPERSGPMLGAIEDLDENGALLRCRNGSPERLDGRIAHLSMQLADPIGRVDDAVRIVSVLPDGAHLLVRIAFTAPNEAIARVLGRHDRGLRRNADLHPTG